MSRDTFTYAIALDLSYVPINGGNSKDNECYPKSEDREVRLKLVNHQLKA